MPEDDSTSDSRAALVSLAPKLFELTDGVLFGDVWARPELCPRDRSLITIAALISGGNVEQLLFHMKKGTENGLSQDEIVEMVTHLAFYCGWPKAMSALQVAKDTLAD